MQNRKHAVFQIGKEEYGLDILAVNTVEKMMKIEPVKNPPKNVKGIVSLRGDRIPVYSLRMNFGLEDKEPDSETRLIITKSNGMLIAYEVDKMQEIADIEPSQLNEVPSIIKNKNTSYMKQVTNVNGRLIVLIDQNGILSEEVQNSIKAIVKK